MAVYNGFEPPSSYDPAPVSEALGLEKDRNDGFCKLTGSSVALVGDDFYITDGSYRAIYGDVNKPESAAPYIETNTRLLKLDLSSQISATATNFASSTVNRYPNLLPPALYGAIFQPDTKNSSFYLYAGGRYDTRVKSIVAQLGSLPDQSKTGQMLSRIMVYSPETSQWSEMPIANGFVPLSLEGGSWTDDTNRGVSYYMDGFHVDNKSLATTVSGLYEFDPKKRTWTELPSFSTKRPTMRGFLEYVPLGKKGVLVKFGGSNWDVGADIGSPTLRSLTSVDIFDIETSTWHSQSTDGSSDGFPAGRHEGCSVVAPAADGSSYNIYMYGGFEEAGGGGHPNVLPRFNDLWVLSIPSFRWVKMYQGDTALGKGEQRCVRYGRHMMMAGGSYAKDRCTPVLSWVDLTTGKFEEKNGVWQGNRQDYAVPEKLYQLIGGSGKGGATQKSPTSGWSKEELKNIFSTEVVIAQDATEVDGSPKPGAGGLGNSLLPKTDVNEQPDSSSSPSIGAIAGGAVGGIVGLAIIGVLIWFFLRQKKRSVIMDDEVYIKPEMDGNEISHKIPVKTSQWYEMSAVDEIPRELPHDGSCLVELDAETQKRN